MATYPLAFLDTFPGTTTRFELVHMQEVSPTRGGTSVAVDTGPALWEADYESKPLSASEFRKWKSQMALLDGSVNTFYGYDLRGCFPIEYPGGRAGWDGTTGVTLTAASVANSTLTFGGLPVSPAPRYQIRAGDYAAFTDETGRRQLYQFTVDALVTAGGSSGAREVRPRVRPVTVASVTDIKFYRAAAIMAVVPGSMSQEAPFNGRGRIAFTARQVL